MAKSLPPTLLCRSVHAVCGTAKPNAGVETGQRVNWPRSYDKFVVTLQKNKSIYQLFLSIHAGLAYGSFICDMHT